MKAMASPKSTSKKTVTTAKKAKKEDPKKKVEARAAAPAAKTNGKLDPKEAKAAAKAAAAAAAATGKPGAKVKAEPVPQAADVAAAAREKLKKRGKGAGEVEGDEIEEQAEEAMLGAEVDPDAEKDVDDVEPIGERKEVKDLLEAGRQKGFLTYDEVNDALPADVVSSDQIDDVMSMFGDNDIEIVDAQKAAQASEVKPTVAATEETEKKEGEEEEEEEEKEVEEPGGKSNDPVRLYLRKMGSVSLLTREGEVEIAKRIEDGEKEVMRALLACKVAVIEIIDIGNRLKAGKLRIREVVKDAPEEPAGEEAEAEVEV